MDEITATIVNKQYWDRNAIELEIYDGNATYTKALWEIKNDLTGFDERLRDVAYIVIKLITPAILDYPMSPKEEVIVEPKTDEEIAQGL